MKDTQPESVEYFRRYYKSAARGNYDIYVVFVEMALSLLNNNGRMGYILPHKFFNSRYGQPLRKIIADGGHLSHVVHFGDKQVFKGATTYTCLLFLNKKPIGILHLSNVEDLLAWKNTGRALKSNIHTNEINHEDWNFNIGENYSIVKKLKNIRFTLSNVAHIFVGTQTSADDVFVLDNCKIVNGIVIGISKSLKQEVKVELSATRPFLRGRQIRRYQPCKSSARLICPYEINIDNCRLLKNEEMDRKYPLTYNYLKSNRYKLSDREKGRFKGGNWYAFGYPKSMTLFQCKKIIVPDYNNSASFTIDSGQYFYKTGYGVILRETLMSPLYILGLINSPLLFQYLRSIGTSLRGGYVRFWTKYIEKLPIKDIDFSNSNERLLHDKMVSLVDRMLDLHKKLSAAKVPDVKTRVQRQIDSTDRQIDKLVYELYGLTEEEIEIVENE